jgi:hypothetical protein
VAVACTRRPSSAGKLAKISLSGHLRHYVGQPVIAFGVGQAVLSSKNLTVSLTDPGVLRSVTGRPNRIGRGQRAVPVVLAHGSPHP